MPAGQVTTTTAPDSSDDAGTVQAGSIGSAASPLGGARKEVRRKGLVLYVILGLAMVVAIGAYFGLRSGVAASTSTHAEAENTLALDPFVVNLDGTGQRAYLRISITLGLSKTLSHKKDDLPIAPLRDAILAVLSSEQPDQLLASEGKEKLKVDLLRALQERAPQLGVENVYFTEFLVQM